MAATRLSIRIDLATGDRIGPGKIALLEAIRSTGSGGRSMGSPPRRAVGISVVSYRTWPPTAQAVAISERGPSGDPDRYAVATASSMRARRSGASPAK